jgi:3D-(3,5/4)-trihydroxycyclohexane-1,2-dione acylhydrolase (decyclizing)
MTAKDIRRLTTAQALITFLTQQFSERDGVEQPFFAGCFGIFGHGNVAGIGQALQQTPELRYIQVRNEQAMVHAAAAFAKVKNRLQTLACTGAAAATINRLPVLLLPGDIFSRRNVAPVLQQLEATYSQEISVNDCFKPVSRYWDRINRPEQLISSLPEALRVLTSPVEAGAVTLALPQDVQAEAYDFPEAFFRRRVWHIRRDRPDLQSLEQAAAWIRASKRPLIVAGGGVIYSEAAETLANFVDRTGIPVGETMAGKGSLRYDHPLNLGGIGVTGTLAANRIAHDADLVIGIGTRYSDFTTSSKTAFQNPSVRFINLNVAEFDGYKQHALPVIGDARVALAELQARLGDFRTDEDYRLEATRLQAEWEAEVERIYSVRHQPLPSQGELIGLLNELSSPEGIMVNAAGSMPGDLHKLWRARHPKNFHLEYGYSCMGYEIAGGLGAKMAAPEREVYVIVGDGSYLMLSSDLATAIQEGHKLIVILWDNGGFKSIGALSRSLGQDGFGTRFVHPKQGMLAGDSAGEAVQPLQIDYPANARSLGADVIECQTTDEFAAAIKAARASERTTVITIRNDRYEAVPGYESWWDVQVAEVSEMPAVQDARQEWETKQAEERYFL